MKGPQLRLRLAIGRLWECPQCRRRETTPGTTVSIACHACSPADALSAVWMKLIDEFPKKRAIMPVAAERQHLSAELHMSHDEQAAVTSP